MSWFMQSSSGRRDRRQAFRSRADYPQVRETCALGLSKALSMPLDFVRRPAKPNRDPGVHCLAEGEFRSFINRAIIKGHLPLCARGKGHYADVSCRQGTFAILWVHL